VPGTQDESDSSSTTWAWILAAALLAVAIALVVFLMRRRARRKRAAQAWHRNAAAALGAATAADTLLSGLGPETGTAEWSRRRAEVESAAVGLDRAGADAVDPNAGEAARSAAADLRSAMFAVEAEVFLRAGPPPTPDQLASADGLRRTRMTELTAALDRLRALAGEEPTPPQ
jgi:flagellar biosynthesis/type III secretory pathway M-ring protein FliF/YscJ